MPGAPVLAGVATARRPGPSPDTRPHTVPTPAPASRQNPDLTG